jgi:hypothetical protein
MNRLILTVALLLITSAAFGQINSEHPVSTPVVGPSTTILASAIASDGDGFLAVWLDWRGSDAHVIVGRTASTISLYASRISGDGAVLDPSGILLAKTADNSSISVAWTGDRYLVVWNDSGDVMAVQLSAGGRVLRPARMVLHAAPLGGRHPLASNGKVAVLIASPGYAVLDRDANIINSDNFPAEAVYLTGAGEFVLTAGGGTTRLDSSGRLATRTTRGWPGVIACRSNGCMTAFGRTNGHLAVASYDPASLVVGQPLDLPIDQSFQYSVNLAATASGYVLVTNTLQRLDSDGHPLGFPAALPGAPSSNSGIASNGRNAALLRSSGGSLTSSILTSAALTQPATVAFSANAQHDVAVTRGSANYLAVWAEKDGTYAGRLSFDGMPLDGRGILLGPNTGTPSIIFDGMSYFVVLRNEFSEYNFLYNYYSAHPSIVRIDPATGAVMSIFSFVDDDLCIASDGAMRIAVWTEEHNSTLMAASLSPSGTIASAPVFIAAPPPGMGIANPSVAWNGTMWFVAWEEELFPGSNLGGNKPYPVSVAVRGARLSTDLIPLDTQPITVSTAPILDILSSRVASDGHDFLVAWTAEALTDGKPSVRVRRVQPTGALADAETIVSRGTVKDLVWDGANYDLAYSGGKPLDLALARLRSSGQPFETLAISTTAGDDRSASLIPLGNGSIFAAYTRVAFEPMYAGVERAFAGVFHPLRGRAAQTH